MYEEKHGVYIFNVGKIVTEEKQFFKDNGITDMNEMAFHVENHVDNIAEEFAKELLQVLRRELGV